MKGRENKGSNFTIVIPSIRRESITPFIKSWESNFWGNDIIVVEDNPNKTFDLPSWVMHYSWEDIDKELGRNSWIIPRHNASIRCFGFLKAWEKKSEYIFTLDDDCLPEKRYKNGGFLEEMRLHLDKEWDGDSWWNTLRGEVYPRGFPYAGRDKLLETVIHHGLWSNIPDLDGITQQKLPLLRTKPFYGVEKVPYGKFYPMCSMNLAFKKEIMPAMYFLLMGEDRKGHKWPYDRFDDIWAGIFSKKICDHLNLAVSSGSPSVRHSRASNTIINIKKEKSGLPVNEWLWKEVENIPLHADTVSTCYLEIAKALGEKGGYWRQLARAMSIWVSFFK